MMERPLSLIPSFVTLESKAVDFISASLFQMQGRGEDCCLSSMIGSMLHEYPDRHTICYHDGISLFTFTSLSIILCSPLMMTMVASWPLI